MPDDLKERMERWVADQFVEWRNRRLGAAHVFSRHGSPPSADVEYIDGSDILHIEVTGAYYDDDAARFDNMNARGLPDAPDSWSSMKADGTVVAIDTSFLESLNARLAEKARKSYSEAPILVLHHVSRFYHSAGLKNLLDQAVIPAQHPFIGIYFLARLPEGDPEGREWIYPLQEEA